MKKSAMIRARVEPEIKEQAEGIFKKIGLSASEAIGLFYRQVKLRGGLPFEVNTSGEGLRSKVAGYAQDALIENSRKISPQQRLDAFVNHSYLLKQMSKAGSKSSSKKDQKKNAG